jgi:hypothetical protein
MVPFPTAISVPSEMSKNMISHFRRQNAVGNSQKAVNFVLNSDGTKSAVGNSICPVENKEKEYTISDGLNAVGNNTCSDCRRK